MTASPTCRRADHEAAARGATPRRPREERRKSTPRRTGRSVFSSRRGSASARPSAKPLHQLRTGHNPQAGRRGVQSVAPRSIIACAKSPGLCFGVRLFAKALISAFASGKGVVTAKSRATTRSILPSTGVAALAEGDRGDRCGGVVADAGKRAKLCLGRGKLAAVPRRPRRGRTHADCGRGRNSRAQPRRRAPRRDRRSRARSR